MPIFILVVPRQLKPLNPKYNTSFVNIKRLSRVTPYVLKEAAGSVPKRYIIIAAILFLSNISGTLLIPYGPLPFACQDQERK